MNAKKCDRCGVFFEPHDYLILKEKRIVSNTSPMFPREYDLCLTCNEEFYDFLNKYKEVIKNEKK